MSHTYQGAQLNYPLPYGAVVRSDGVQFVVISRPATAMRLLLYEDVADLQPSEVISFNPDKDRWGDVWSIFVPGLEVGQLYHFQADGPFDPVRGHRFDSRAQLIDPYALALAGNFQSAADGIVRPPKCVVVDIRFDWQGDRHLKRNLSESIIYELHVGGFTRSPTSNVNHPGTYLAVIEKIPYLKSLGITAVELMPVHEFPIYDITGQQPNHPNFWGYDPLAFFAPHRGYAAPGEPGCQVRQFKEMVRALHAADIEVILDVVFNHTAEGSQEGPILSFKGLDNRVYYSLNGHGSYRNYSGCGNTVNGNHPIVREMIFHCLRHWVHNYHIDGFRFDLASVLNRDRSGKLVPNPPVVELISEDPMLADAKIIAEAWDAAGAYQVGSFSKRRWSEWNGRYRDEVRRYWRGDEGMTGLLATRFVGSSDLYQPAGRKPYHSINFVTSHDGFTLHDLVSYAEKHNEENGEENHDGDDNNFSWNCGVEGPTRRSDIRRLRLRQAKNMMATLLLSQGVPMLLSGDEFGRTQRGNNNAYCQDNQISWLNWGLLEKQQELIRFCQALIAIRKKLPVLRQEAFLTGQAAESEELPDVGWFRSSGQLAGWENLGQSLICLLGANERTDSVRRHVLVLFHAGEEPHEFFFPKIALQFHWRLFLDTAANSPADIFPDGDGPVSPKNGRRIVAQQSLCCYIATL